MAAAGRQGERAAQRHAEQPAAGVQQLEERLEVVLVGAAAVQQDERPGGPVARGLPDDVGERVGQLGHATRRA